MNKEYLNSFTEYHFERNILEDLLSLEANTQAHSLGVLILASKFYKTLGIPIDRKLLYGVMLHDVGKKFTPDLVRKKELTEDEWYRLQEHPLRGADYLYKTGKESLVDLSAVAFHHAPNYPNHIDLEAIPLHVRALTLVDAFDALTIGRSYRKAYQAEDALLLIGRQCGTSYDPHLFRMFIVNDTLWRGHKERREEAMLNFQELMYRQPVVQAPALSIRGA